MARNRAYANAIDEILLDCIQVADRFNLFQDLINHLKDIFKQKFPNEIFLKDEQVLDSTPKKIVRENRGIRHGAN